MDEPLVSVIIPTFNRAQYVREAATSILGQTMSDLELLIVDDASTDDTPAVLRELAEADDRVHPLRAERNVGCNRARNMALDRVRGQYVAFLDDDDVALAHRLEESIAVLAEHPSSGVVSGSYQFIDALGRERPGSTGGIDMGADEANADHVFELLYCDWAWLPLSTLTCRASVFLQHRFPHTRRPDGDSRLLCQMAASGIAMCRLDRTCTLMRRDPSHASMSSDRVLLMAARRETLLLLRDWLRKNGISRFDHLHARAWSNHLINEAKHLGGLRGVFRGIEAVVRDPNNPVAVAYVRSRLLGRARRLLRE